MNVSIFFIIITSIISFSCAKEGQKKGAIPEEVLVDCYARTLIVQEEGKIGGRDSVSIAARIDSVLHSNNLSRSEFEQSLEYYKLELTRWKKFYELVAKRLEVIPHQENAKPQS